MNRAKRKSGIELLRIIAMLQIIFLHICDYGGLNEYSEQYGDLDKILVNGMWSFCRAPVDVFIMISGYFLITSQFSIKKSVSRVGKLYAVMIFYSLVLAAVFFICDPSLIKVNKVIKAFLPLSANTWYFLSNYIIILLLSPFINKLLTSVTKKQYIFLLAILFAVISVWATLAKIKGFNTVFDIKKVLDPYKGKSLLGFLLAYVIGGFLRLYVPQGADKRTGKHTVNFKYLAAFALLCLADFTLKLLFDKEYDPVFGMYNNPLVLCESAMLLLFFRDFSFSSAAVNTVAGTTLGIYALHENPYVRDWLWSIFSFSDKSLYDSLIYVPYALAVVVVVFSACCVIELIRQKLFDAVKRLFKSIKESKHLPQ